MRRARAGAGARPIASGASFEVEKFVRHPVGMLLRCEATGGTHKGEAGVTLVRIKLAGVKLGVTIGLRAGKEGALVEAFGGEHATALVATAGCGGGRLVVDTNGGRGSRG